jgi:hypothetical protein
MEHAGHISSKEASSIRRKALRVLKGKRAE